MPECMLAVRFAPVQYALRALNAQVDSSCCAGHTCAQATMLRTCCLCIRCTVQVDSCLDLGIDARVSASMLALHTCTVCPAVVNRHIHQPAHLAGSGLCLSQQHSAQPALSHVTSTQSTAQHRRRTTRGKLRMHACAESTMPCAGCPAGVE